MYRIGSMEEIIYAYHENVIITEGLHCFNESGSQGVAKINVIKRRLLNVN